MFAFRLNRFWSLIFNGMTMSNSIAGSCGQFSHNALKTGKAMHDFTTFKQICHAKQMKIKIKKIRKCLNDYIYIYIYIYTCRGVQLSEILALACNCEQETNFILCMNIAIIINWNSNHISSLFGYRYILCTIEDPYKHVLALTACQTHLKLLTAPVQPATT